LRVTSGVAERAKLAAVADHVARLDRTGRRTLDEMAAWIAFRLKQIDALLGAQFLDISARSADVDFTEKPVGDHLEEFSEYRYYSRPAVLRLWSIDHDKDQAFAVAAFRWATEAGVLPGPTLADASDTS
jgi:hypothetical protein